MTKIKRIILTFAINLPSRLVTPPNIYILHIQKIKIRCLANRRNHNCNLLVSAKLFPGHISAYHNIKKESIIAHRTLKFSGKIVVPRT